MSARQSAAVDEAMRLIAGGMTPYRAAKTVQIALSTVYRACARNGIVPKKKPRKVRLSTP